jgi:hypothetical protein
MELWAIADEMERPEPGGGVTEVIVSFGDVLDCHTGNLELLIVDHETTQPGRQS